MKKPKRLILLLSLTVLAAALLCVCAGAVYSSPYTYEVSNGKAIITDCSTSVSGKLTIPDTLGGYPVTSIGFWAFRDCTSLTAVTIPDSVTSIGDFVFENCSSLTAVTIGSGVTSIGGYAFEDTAYYNNSSNWENGVLYIGKYLIKAKDTLSGSYTVKDGTRCIAGSAFAWCTSLTAVVIPDSVTSIGEGAFLNCTSLTGVTIPDSVTSIGSEAFWECDSLTAVVIGNGVTSIGYWAFYECTSLTAVTIPDSVTSIGYDAFKYCTNLQSITLPFVGGSATDNRYLGYLFGDGGFNNNDHVPTSLKTVILSDACTSIAEYAFEFCGSITNITIPDSLTSIGERAFYGCDALTDINYGGTKSQWNELYIADDESALTTAKIHYAKGWFPVIVIVIGAAGVSLLGYCVNKAKKSKAKEGTAD